MAEYQLAPSDFRVRPNQYSFQLPQATIDGLGEATLLGSTDLSVKIDGITGLAIVNNRVIRKPAVEFEDGNALRVNVEIEGIKSRGPFSVLAIASHPEVTLATRFDVIRQPGYSDDDNLIFGYCDKWWIGESKEEYYIYSYPDCRELSQFRFRFQWLRNLTGSQSPGQY